MFECLQSLDMLCIDILLNTCRNGSLQHSTSLHFMTGCQLLLFTASKWAPDLESFFITSRVCVVSLFSETQSRYILLALLHCSSVSLAIICPKMEEKVVFFSRSKQYIAATQVKYEKWFSLPIFSGVFLPFLAVCTFLFYLLLLYRILTALHIQNWNFRIWDFSMENLFNCEKML